MADIRRSYDSITDSNRSLTPSRTGVDSTMSLRRSSIPAHPDRTPGSNRSTDVQAASRLVLVSRRPRDEVRNGRQFDGLLEAKAHVSDWRIDYNKNRPHTAHGDLIPTEFAQAWAARNQPLHARQLRRLPDTPQRHAHSGGPSRARCERRSGPAPRETPNPTVRDQDAVGSTDKRTASSVVVRSSMSLSCCPNRLFTRSRPFSANSRAS